MFPSPCFSQAPNLCAAIVGLDVMPVALSRRDQIRMHALVSVTAIEKIIA
jgi:hypothetical protein